MEGQEHPLTLYRYRGDGYDEFECCGIATKENVPLDEFQAYGPIRFCSSTTDGPENTSRYSGLLTTVDGYDESHPSYKYWGPNGQPACAKFVKDNALPYTSCRVSLWMIFSSVTVHSGTYIVGQNPMDLR